MTPKRILIMDDSPLVLDLAQAALEEAGYQVCVAADLASFEAQRLAHPPDLILLDVQMPEAFGDDIGGVLRAVRQVRVPIVLFSNVGDAELKQRVREAELDGFISKRAGLDVLVARVTAILGTEQAR